MQSAKSIFVVLIVMALGLGSFLVFPESRCVAVATLEFSPRSIREPILDADPEDEAIALHRKLTSSTFRSDVANSFTATERTDALSPQSAENINELDSLLKDVSVERRKRPDAYCFTIRATHSSSKAALLIANRYAALFLQKEKTAADRAWAVHSEYLRKRLEEAHTELKNLTKSSLADLKAGAPESSELKIARYQVEALQQRIAEGEKEFPLRIVGPAVLE